MIDCEIRELYSLKKQTNGKAYEKRNENIIERNNCSEAVNNWV